MDVATPANPVRLGREWADGRSGGELLGSQFYPKSLVISTLLLKSQPLAFSFMSLLTY